MNINDLILNGYENTRLLTADELLRDGYNTVEYDKLGETSVTGVLKANRYADGKLVQTYSDNEHHVGVIAATRQGKTSSYVIPTIVSFAKQKTKRSMIIADPKGELYRSTSQTLRDEGYEVLLINLRDYKHSECWNPLTEIYRKYRRAIDLPDEVRAVQTADGFKNIFFDKVYEDQRELDGNISYESRMLLDEVDNDITNLAETVAPTRDTVPDPYWDTSARNATRGFLWAMLEDSDPNKRDNRITEETFSFNTLLNIKSSFGNIASDGDFMDYGYFTDRNSDTSRAYQLVKSPLLDNAGRTRGCIVANLDASLSLFYNAAIRTVTSCNSFDMSILTGERPVAVYIDFRDELKTHYQFISMFVQAAYAYLIEYANKKQSGKLDVPFYFILDEFGNFPKILNFDTVISACGGRNIYFILVLQSYAQLRNIYQSDVADIIRDNLNVHVFFGSNNPSTLDEFSKECGKRARISPRSALCGTEPEIVDYNVDEVSVMPVSTLAALKPSECIVTEINSGYVLSSRLERYFTCAEFKDLPIANERDYVCRTNPFDDKYRYVMKRSYRRRF